MGKSESKPAGLPLSDEDYQFVKKNTGFSNKQLQEYFSEFEVCYFGTFTSHIPVFFVN